MALDIFSEYAGRSNPPDSEYPTGSIKNRSVQDAKDGTPLTAPWGNDMVGFTDALLAAAGIAHSGNPDTLLLSDRIMALKRYTVMRAAASICAQGNDVIMWGAGLTVAASGVVIREDGSGMTASHRVYYNSGTSFILNASIQVDIDAGRLNLIDLNSLVNHIESIDSTLSNHGSSITSNAQNIASLGTTVTSHGNSISSNTSAITTLNNKVGFGAASQVIQRSALGDYSGIDYSALHVSRAGNTVTVTIMATLSFTNAMTTRSISLSLLPTWARDVVPYPSYTPFSVITDAITSVQVTDYALDFARRNPSLNPVATNHIQAGVFSYTVLS